MANASLAASTANPIITMLDTSSGTLVSCHAPTTGDLRELLATRTLQEDDGERETHAPVEREDDAVRRAAEQRPDAELHDRGLERVPEGRQPSQAGHRRRDVRLLRDPPKRAEVRQRVRDRRSEDGQSQTHPGTARQRREGRRSAQFLKQTEEPVRGR